MSEKPPKQLLQAEYVFSAAGPLQRGAGVVIDGDRIVAVGDRALLRRDHPDAQLIELGAAIVLPGLVNAHTHLELSSLSPPAQPQSFTDWILELMEVTKTNHRDGEKARNSVLKGVAQCRRFGVTTVGDISANPEATRSVLCRMPALRAVSYGEVRGMARRRQMIEPRVQAASNQACRRPWLRIAISPHAPYSTEPSGYARSLEVAKRERLPITTHLAESGDEAEFLEYQTGPFRELWRAFDAWDEFVPRFAGGPIRFARDFGLLDYPTSLAHVNYCDDNELGILTAGKASVVYCPRTHRYFGHPSHRWREMLAVGINVAVGTDSCASSPDLNLVDDLRLIHEIAPELPVEDLWQMATIRAARAIQWDDKLGSILPGKCADFTVFEVTSDQPLREILEDPSRLPREAWIGGQKVTNTRPVSPC